MKILEENVKSDGTVAVKLCLCKTQESTCKPKDRPVRIFQNKGKLATFKKAFRL
jgi:hypothetical protein